VKIVLTKEMAEKKAFERLPKAAVPSNYAIRLKPDLDRLTFEGIEHIAVQVNSWLLYSLALSHPNCFWGNLRN